MDEALWDPPHDQVSEESPYDFQNEHHDSQDVIEEESLNEKYCLQVLRILVAKADAEIIELEEDILILQTQLALANEDWSNLCFAALRERIDHLEILIQSLKDNVANEHDPDVRSQLHREPAEKIHVILRDLLSNNFQPKAEQPAKTFDTTPSILEPDVSKKEDSGKYSSEERKTLDRKEGFESKDEDASRNPFAKPQVMDSTSNTEKLGTEKLKEEKKSNNLTSGKKADVVEKHKNDDSIIRDPAKNVLMEASIKCGEKDLKKIDSKDKQIAEKHSSTPKKAGDTPNPPLIDENEKSTIALEKDTKAYTLGNEIAFSGQNTQKNIFSEASSLEEARRQSSTVDSIISNTHLNLVLKEKKSVYTVKVEAAFLDCKSDAAKLMVKDSSLKQEPKRALEANLIDARQKLVPTQKMKTKTDQRINGEKRGLHKTEYSFPESLLELLKNNRKDASKPSIKVKQKSQVRHIPKHEAYKCSSNLSWKRKRPFLQEPCLAEELGLNLTSLGKFKRQQKPGIVVKSTSGCSDNENAKKENQQDLGGAKMSDAAPDVTIASVPQQAKERKISAKSPVVKQNDELRNFRIESSNTHDHTTDQSTIKKGLRIVNYSDDSDDEIPKSPSSPESLYRYLQCKSLIELRAIAKKLNLSRYSKLPKRELIHLLVPNSKPSN